MATPVVTEKFTDELDALAQKCKLEPALRDFLIKMDFLDTTDICLLGESDGDALQALKSAAPSDGTINWNLTVEKNVKKLWTFCRAAKPQPSSSASAVVVAQSNDDEAPLPDGVPEAVEKAWVAKHGFHLSGARLLIGGDYNRVYNCLNKKRPRELPKMDPEKYRLANEGVTGESKGMFLGEDGTIQSRKKFFAEIIAHDML